MKTNDHTELVRSILPQALDYSGYRQLVGELFAKGKTTGHDQSSKMLAYTELNIIRMNKWDKHFKLHEDVVEMLRNYDRDEQWLVITEGWCGDAAHAVPVMARMAEYSDAINIKYVLRDEHPELMDLFLTNGGRSIPKLIRMNAHDHSIINTWGPRPAELQEDFLRAKARGEDMEEHKKQMQIWYARNRGQAILGELIHQLDFAEV